MNKTKFERNSSLEYYHMTCVEKTKHTSLRGLLQRLSIKLRLTTLTANAKLAHVTKSPLCSYLSLTVHYVNT